MKQLIASLLLAGFVLLTSCQKEELPTPATSTSTATQNIVVEYKVYAESGKFSYEYSAPGLATGETVKGVCDRSTQSFTIHWTSGEKLMLKAFNTTPSHKEVDVEIYVNGVLFKSASATAAGTAAVAEGTY